jgi:SEC-C motif
VHGRDRTGSYVFSMSDWPFAPYKFVLRDCTMDGNAVGIYAPRGIDGLYVDGLRARNTPTLIRANGPLTNSLLRNIEHPALRLPPDAPCWCGSGRRFKKCHARRWKLR